MPRKIIKRMQQRIELGLAPIYFFLLFFIVFSFQAKQSKAIGLGEIETEENESITQKIRFAESLSEQMQKDPTDSESLGKLYAQLGELYFYDEQYTKAIDYYFRSLLVRDKNPEELRFFGAKTPWLLIDIGNVLYRIGEHQTAKTVYYHAFQIFQEKNDKRGLTTCLNNLGLCELALYQFDKAYKVFKTSYQMSLELHDEPCQFASGLYISIALKRMERYTEALHYLKDINKIQLRKEDEHLLGYRHLELGETFLGMGQKDSARKIFIMLANNEQLYGVESSRLNALLRLSNMDEEIGNTESAIMYANTAWEMLKTYPNNSFKLQTSYQLYTLYKIKSDYAKALMFHEEFEKYQHDQLKSKMSGYIEDYNQRIERISSYWEKKQYIMMQKAAVQEKNSQMQLSYFLVAISILMIVMIISGKGTETRINALQEYIGSLTFPTKRNIVLAIIIYFISFHFIFSPVGIDKEELSYSIINRLWPGVISIAAMGLSLFLFFRIQMMKKRFEGKCRHHYLISLSFILLLVFLALGIYYYGFSGKGFIFVLSLFMLVLASFIFPLYFGIIIIEKVIIRHFEHQAAIIAGGLAQKNATEVIEEEKIVIESEKTSGKMEFYLKNLLYIESQGNYCMFYIDTNNGLKKKMLHTTMKSVENHLSGIMQVVRCHKSFIVNIQRIKNVSGNSRGYELHFGEGVDTVPVSRGYQNDVMGTIREYIDGNS